MEFIQYVSTAAIPIMIMVIIGYGLLEKKKVYEIFVDGAQEGMEMVMKLVPTLLGIFVAVGALRSSGILDCIVTMITPVCELLRIPSQIMPLALLRPISGSASIAVATDIMNQYGVDSFTGLVASTIMGSTETTLYTIAVYTGCVGIKNIRFVLFASLIADIIGMITSVAIWRILS